MVSTLDELLDEQLAEEGTPVCVINKATRKIDMPEEYKFFGVENDKKVERIQFECAKEVGDENLDLMTCEAVIIYENANGEPGLYEIKDMVADGDAVRFSWLFDEDVTIYKGKVRFALYVFKPDGSEREAAWNTIPAEGVVEEGLDAVIKIEERNPSIIESIILRLNKIEKTGISSEQLLEAINEYFERNPVNDAFFVVSIDFDANVASHSASEIRDAFEQAKIVITMDVYGMIMPLYGVSQDIVHFEGIYESDGLKKSRLSVDENKNVIFYTEDIVIGGSGDATAAAIGTAELLAANWSEDGDGAYTQEIAIAGIPDSVDLKRCKVDIVFPKDVLLTLCNKRALFVTENKDGIVTVNLIGQKLTDDYEVQVALTEVECSNDKIVGATVGTPGGGEMNGGSDKWEVIADVTTTEEVSQVTVDKDINGNSYALKKFRYSIVVVSTDTNTENKELQVWGRQQGEYSVRYAYTNDMVRPGNFASRLELFGDTDMRSIKQMSSYLYANNKTSWPTSIMGNCFTYETGKATQAHSPWIFFDAKTSGVFGVGTRIILLGVRA